MRLSASLSRVNCKAASSSWLAFSMGSSWSSAPMGRHTPFIGRTAQCIVSGPLEPRHDRTAHDPVFVVLGEEWQLLAEMSDTLAIGRLVERVRHVGAPIAALRPERIEAAFDEWQHVAVRIGLG